MSYRYPWESTTYSTPLSKFKYSSPSSNLLSSTSSPYKRVIPFATTPATKYTYTTASYFYANKYKTKVTNSNDGSNSKYGYAGGTTTRKYTNYSYYTVSPISKVTNDLNYPKISPFKRKVTVGTVSFATATKGDQKGLQSYTRGKSDLYQKSMMLAFLFDYKNHHFFISSIDRLGCSAIVFITISSLSTFALFYFLATYLFIILSRDWIPRLVLYCFCLLSCI